MPTLLEEIWNRRSLIILLAFNDVKARYRNSVLGFFWSFLEPLLMLGVLYLVFTNIFKNSIENYPIYLLLGLIMWYMFSRATSMGQTSLLDKAGIVQKIYVRRELIVLSACLTSLIMMCFEFVAFAFFAIVFHFIPPSTILLLPLLIIDLFILSLGISLVLSVLTVYFRDIKFVWHVALQVGFFTTPIFYRLEVFPDLIKRILELNPMASIVDTAHKIVIYGTLPTIEESLHITISTLIIFLIGYVVFRSKDKRLVEKI
ncbi:MAG TPA: ABC transporter permease [Nitrosopumilaceae archaeon]|nr:ABC transporter permease [Nitrosopumilaceae archaeon]